MAIVEFGGFRFDPGTGLSRGGRAIHLSPLQQRLLHTFCDHAETILSKEDLILKVWNHTNVSDISLSRTVHELRQKLGGGPQAKQMIHSIYGIGYVFSPAGHHLPQPGRSRSAVGAAQVPPLPQPAASAPGRLREMVGSRRAP